MSAVARIFSGIVDSVLNECGRTPSPVHDVANYTPEVVGSQSSVTKIGDQWPRGRPPTFLPATRHVHNGQLLASQGVTQRRHQALARFDSPTDALEALGDRVESG